MKLYKMIGSRDFSTTELRCSLDFSIQKTDISFKKFSIWDIFVQVFA